MEFVGEFMGVNGRTIVLRCQQAAEFADMRVRFFGPLSNRAHLRYRDAA